jgi:hypothetical protein
MRRKATTIILIAGLGAPAGNRPAEGRSSQRSGVRLLRRWVWSLDADYLRLAFSPRERIYASGLSRTREATSSISSPVSASSERLS